MRAPIYFLFFPSSSSSSSSSSTLGYAEMREKRGEKKEEISQRVSLGCNFELVLETILENNNLRLTIQKRFLSLASTESNLLLISRGKSSRAFFIRSLQFPYSSTFNPPPCTCSNNRAKIYSSIHRSVLLTLPRFRLEESSRTIPASIAVN